MTKKQIIRGVSFLLVLTLFLGLMCDLFEIENTKNYDKLMYTYRKLPKNTVDAVYIGNSGATRYWLAPKAFEEYGLSMHSVAVDSMPSWLYTNLIEEARSQNPSLYVIDLRAFEQDNNNASSMDTYAHRFLDALPFFSWNRIVSAFKTMNAMKVATPEKSWFDASLLFSFIRFHNKWSDNYFFKDNFGSNEHLYGGFYLHKDRSATTFNNKPVVYDPNIKEPLGEISEKALYDVFEYIEKHNLNVLFIYTPKFMTKSQMGKFNTIREIVEKEGYPYLHYFKENSSKLTIDLDPDKDFYDEGHVNYYGAEKFTPILAEYLIKNYKLPDRRGDEVVEKYWNGKYDLIKKRIAEYKVS